MTDPVTLVGIVPNFSDYDILKSLNILTEWKQEVSLKRSLFYYRDKFHNSISKKLKTKKINDFPEYKENLLQLFNQFCNKAFSNNEIFSKNQQLTFEKLIEISEKILKSNPNPQTIERIKQFFSSLLNTDHYFFFPKIIPSSGKEVLNIFRKIDEVFKQDNINDEIKSFQLNTP